MTDGNKKEKQTYIGTHITVQLLDGILFPRGLRYDSESEPG